MTETVALNAETSPDTGLTALRKIWYLFIAAQCATIVFFILFVAMHYIANSKVYYPPGYSVWEMSLEIGFIFGLAFGMLTHLGALLIGLPVYSYILPPRRLLTASIVGFLAGASIVGAWLACIYFIDGALRPEFYILYQVYFGLVSVCGTVFMVVLAWLTNRGLRTQADAAPDGGGDEAAS